MKKRLQVERRTRRWQEQRWLLDIVVATVGPEWDQGRIQSRGARGGPECMAAFRAAASRMKKFNDIGPEFTRQARKVETHARQYEKEKRDVSAREQYYIAALLYASAQWPYFDFDDTVVELEKRMNASFAKYCKYAPRPTRRVEIPFGKGKTLPAYLHLPHAPAKGERFPVTLVTGGMDGSKENMVALYGDGAIERGFAVLALDGPGQGECPGRGIYLTPTNFGDAGKACVDWLCDQPEIDSDRIIIRGSSFGTYFGTQAAAKLGNRIKGVSATGVCQEPGAHTIFNMASPTFKVRFMFMCGFENEAKFDTFVKGFDLRKIAAKVKCPYMIVAGEDDQLSPIENTYKLFEKIKSPRRLVVYESANHSVRGGPAVANGENRETMMFNWMLDRVGGKPMKSELWYIDASGKANITKY
jgi:pimeloyl-ACP methyl ester carboxylesterase